MADPAYVTHAHSAERCDKPFFLAGQELGDSEGAPLYARCILAATHNIKATPHRGPNGETPDRTSAKGENE